MGDIEVDLLLLILFHDHSDLHLRIIIDAKLKEYLRVLLLLEVAAKVRSSSDKPRPRLHHFQIYTLSEYLHKARVATDFVGKLTRLTAILEDYSFE